jgi:hypothetical protein
LSRFGKLIFAISLFDFDLLFLLVFFLLRRFVDGNVLAAKPPMFEGQLLGAAVT